MNATIYTRYSPRPKKDGDEERQAGVYAIRCLVNGRQYVGSASQSFLNRWRMHRHQLRTGKHHSRHLQRAWNKYGEQAFSFRVLEVTLPEHATAQEQVFINWLNTADRRFGFNAAPQAGSTLGTKRSKETVEKCRRSALKRWSDPVQIEKARLATLKQFSDPSQVEKQRRASLKQWSDPVSLAKQKKGQLRRFSKPEEIEKARQRALKRLASETSEAKAARTAKGVATMASKSPEENLAIKNKKIATRIRRTNKHNLSSCSTG